MCCNEIFCSNLRYHAFDGGIFFEGGIFGISSTLIDAHTLPGQTEGLKVGCGGMGGGKGEKVYEVWVDRWAEGEVKPKVL